MITTAIIIKKYWEKYNLTGCEVYQNDLLHSPITMGIVHPKIILPFTSYSEKQLQMVMEHEINHIRCHDLLWRKIGLLITLIHWWNPLAYQLLNLLTIYQEIVNYFGTKYLENTNQ